MTTTTTTSLAVILTTKATKSQNERHRRDISPTRPKNDDFTTRATLRSDPGPQLKGLKRYKLLNLIGDGSYGLVYLALHLESGENVAIKTMKRKYHSWDEVLDLKEVRSLKKLHHPNVVRLREVMRENNTLYFVFEYVPYDLLDVLRQTRADQAIPDNFVKHVTLQVLQGLAYMHRLGFFHRDLKPENILISSNLASTANNESPRVKIADFGLAREIRSAPPFTDYVSTRWYRAPEVLLRSNNYSSPIDVWAVGCIASELFTKRPLFPGSSEIDQLYKISSILGTPSRSEWNEGYLLASAMSFRFPAFKVTHLSQVLGPRSTTEAISFLYSCLNWNPSRRFTAVELVKHAFLRNVSNNERFLSGTNEGVLKGNRMGLLARQNNNNNNKDLSKRGRGVHNELSNSDQKMGLMNNGVKSSLNEKSNYNLKSYNTNANYIAKDDNSKGHKKSGEDVFDDLSGIPFGKPGIIHRKGVKNSNDFGSNRGVTLKERQPRFSDLDQTKTNSTAKNNNNNSFSQWRQSNPLVDINVNKNIDEFVDNDEFVSNEEFVSHDDSVSKEEGEVDVAERLRKTFELDVFNDLKDNSDTFVAKGTKYVDVYGVTRNNVDDAITSAASKHNGFQDKNAHHALLSQSMPNFNTANLGAAEETKVYHGRRDWASKYLNA